VCQKLIQRPCGCRPHRHNNGPSPQTPAPRKNDSGKSNIRDKKRSGARPKFPRPNSVPPTSGSALHHPKTPKTKKHISILGTTEPFDRHPKPYAFMRRRGKGKKPVFLVFLLFVLITITASPAVFYLHLQVAADSSPDPSPEAILHVSLPDGTYVGPNPDKWLDERWLLSIIGDSGTFTVRLNNTSAANLKSFSYHRATPKYYAHSAHLQELEAKCLSHKFLTLPDT